MPTVLMIDDDPGAQYTLRRMLERRGYDVVIAADGEQALESLRRIRPDVVVLDLLMPRLNGLQLLGEIARHPEWSGIPILVITGSITPESSVRDLGARALLRKPFSMSQFLTAVGALTGQPAREQDASSGVKRGGAACVLIVEDEPDVRHMLQTMLTLEGYETMTAANGREALDRMRDRQPCAVLLDLMMPVMDGWQFRRQQLEEPRFAEVPVVCITAVSDTRKVESDLGLTCLRKPLDVEVLLKEVAACCRTHSR